MMCRSDGVGDPPMSQGLTLRHPGVLRATEGRTLTLTYTDCMVTVDVDGARPHTNR